MSEKSAVDMSDKDLAAQIHEKLRKIQPTDHPSDLANLKSRLMELESANKILGGKLSEIVDIVTAGPDNRIIELEMKFRQLETEKNELDYHMNLTRKEQMEHIDKLVDSIRKLTNQNAELEINVRTLKNKVPQLEDLTRKQEANIEAIRQRYNDNTFEKIKLLETNVMTLEESCKRLEDQVEKMSEKQYQMSEEAEQKMKQTFEQKLELESKITKLKGKIKEMERINADLVGRMDEMKMKAQEVAETDKERNIRSAAELEALNEQLKMISDDKIKLEKENNNLKKEIKIMKVKLVAYEKEL